MVRLNGAKPDIRYRAGFPKWGARFNVTFNADLITIGTLFNLVEISGVGGVGDWRPEKSKSGSFGCFRVAMDGELDALIKELGTE